MSRVETWLPVVGWVGLYEVSDLGRVRSLDRIVLTDNGRCRPYLRRYRGRILSPAVHPQHGYHSVVLSAGGRPTTAQVHVLVLLAFAGPPKPGQQARHGPGGPGDNRWPENLCWGTQAENEADKLRDGTSQHGERNHQAKLTEAIVRECRRRAAAGETRGALAAEFGVCRPVMSMAVSGRTWQHVA
jgi:hypothetical protein